MNLRPPFLVEDVQKIHAFIASISFATFISTGKDEEPIASHLPVNLLPAQGRYGTLIGHLANSNPHVHFMADKPLLVIFASFDTYISPSWFADRASAPTQTQRVAHCYGRARVIKEVEGIRAIMEQQVQSREQGRANEWSTAELGEEGYTRRLRSISGIEMPIERILASFRLMQDETDTRNVECAVNALTQSGNQPMADLIAEANAARCPHAIKL